MTDDLRGELDDLLSDQYGIGYSRLADQVWAITQRYAAQQMRAVVDDALKNGMHHVVSQRVLRGRADALENDQ